MVSEIEARSMSRSKVVCPESHKALPSVLLYWLREDPVHLTHSQHVRGLWHSFGWAMLDHELN